MMQQVKEQLEHLQKQNTDLLNRASSKDWQVYQQLNSPYKLYNNSDPDNPHPPRGMSDAEELSRIYAGSQGVGEIYEQEMAEDLVELGFLPDE